MKFFQAATYAILAGQVAVAAPIVDGVTDLVEHSSRDPQHEVIAALDRRELEKRINCRAIRHVIRAIGTSKITGWYITSATVLTRGICAYVHGSDCAELSLIIQTALYLIYLTASHYSGAQPETLPGARKRDVHASYVSWWVNVLNDSSNDLIYNDISSLPFDNKEILQRRDGDPALVSRVLLSGLTGSHSPNTKQDIIVNHFADGNTLLHLPIGESYTDKLGKRVPPGSGFKVSYTTRAKSKLSRTHLVEMSSFAAAAWAATSSLYDMTDFIGFAQTDHDANFYYRTIPESRRFVLSYKPVDIVAK
ncbi:hypothetical protein TARUN_393 [Trichoderma arundinaceum]|uniref:Uncharacterized protein n=1 Tax=Trichoderma arundinaceum TaxID=490622 RepID=A0A395P0E2_TRIAR|nr:hypothetical protein TARUN_393 [Trichoderma arundinaceum]